MLAPYVAAIAILQAHRIPSDLPPRPCTVTELKRGAAACVLIDRKELPEGFSGEKAETLCDRAVECDGWVGVDYPDNPKEEPTEGNAP